MSQVNRFARPALPLLPALLLAALAQLGGAQPASPLALSSLSAQTLTLQSLSDTLGAASFSGLAADAAQERIGTFEQDLGRLGFQRGWSTHQAEGDFTAYYSGGPNLTVIRSVEGSEEVSMTAYALRGKVSRHAFPTP